MKKSKRNNRLYTTVQCEVNVQRYNSEGEVTDAIAASAKLTKADAGRTQTAESLSIVIEQDQNGKALPKVTVSSQQSNRVSPLCAN